MFEKIKHSINLDTSSSDIVNNDLDDEIKKAQQSLARFSLSATFISSVIAASGIMLGAGMDIVVSCILSVTGSSLITGAIIGSTKMANKNESQFHKTSLALINQMLNRVDDLVDGKFQVSSKTNHFDSIIYGRLSAANITLNGNDTRMMNQFLYLLNANYYPLILNHFPTKQREDVIIETVDQVFTYLIQNNINQFSEKEIKQFFKGYQLLSKKEKKDFLKELKQGRFKNISTHQYEYTVFPNNMDKEEEKPINPMFQMKEKQDSYQLDLSMILDIKQRIARLSPESQEKYNLWLDKIISEQKQDSFGPNMDFRGQLCNLFAEVDFEQKAMINPKVYHEFFHQFSFYVSSNELDSDSFSQGLERFYSMVQFLEIHKSSVDFTDFLELQGMATEIFYKVLIYYDEYTTDILRGMTDNYRNSVSIYIREQLENLLQEENLPQDYLSIYTLNQSDIPILQYINHGIKILRKHESDSAISTQQELIRKHSIEHKVN